MMQNRTIALAGIACLVFLASLGSTNEQQEDQTIILLYVSMSEGGTAYDVNDATGFESLPQAVQQLLLSCSYKTKGDYPHTSNSDTEASAHGWCGRLMMTVPATALSVPAWKSNCNRECAHMIEIPANE